LRMPFNQIDTILNWAKEIDALVFIDIQVGLSTLQQEVPEFEKYLAMPNVHFGIDPEFSMKGGQRPGTVIGSFDAADINYVTEYLAGIVNKYNIPPKVLILHRFTQGMITNYKQIKLRPEVQLVMDMDGKYLSSIYLSRAGTVYRIQNFLQERYRKSRCNGSDATGRFVETHTKAGIYTISIVSSECILLTNFPAFVYE
jgi:hypothetical protein